MARLPRVYLAGKISKHDWRHGLFSCDQWGGNRFNGGGYGPILQYNAEHDYIDVIAPGDVTDGFEYAGPYFLGDDHGCFHNPSGHGLIDPGWADGPGIEGNWPSPLSRRTVMRSCLRWMESADVVFCWLESLDAYGTLVELGYAAARGIPIYLATDMNVQAEWMAGQPDYHEPPVGATPAEVEAWEDNRRRNDRFLGWEGWADLWFVRALATGLEGEWTAKGAWQDFVQWWQRRGNFDPDRRRFWLVEAR